MINERECIKETKIPSTDLTGRLWLYESVIQQLATQDGIQYFLPRAAEEK
jgi:hypothetical protein